MAASRKAVALCFLSSGRMREKGDPRGVVDADVDELPARAAGFPLPSVAGDAVTDGLEAAELVDVEVDQLARLLPLVAAHRLGRLEGAEPAEAQALQDAAHGGRRDAELESDRLAGPALPPQVPDPRSDPLWSRPVQAMRSRRAVDKPGRSLRAPARHPLPHRLGADPEGRGHGLRGLPLLHYTTHQFGSTTRRQAGILMDVHSVLRRL
jgi:hypothetical protein